MTSSSGLRVLSRLEAGCGVLQTPTDDDRCQRAKQYLPIRWASKNKLNIKNIRNNNNTRLTASFPGRPGYAGNRNKLF